MYSQNELSPIIDVYIVIQGMYFIPTYIVTEISKLMYHQNDAQYSIDLNQVIYFI